MNARTTAGVEPLGHGGVIASRGKQLHVAFCHLQQGFFDAVALNNFTMIDNCTKGLAVVVNCCAEVGDSDCDVVNFGKQWLLVCSSVAHVNS